MADRAMPAKNIHEEKEKIERTQEKISKKDNKKIEFLKDISNEPQKPELPANFTDFKTLYETQLEINEELREKISLLEEKIKYLTKENQELKEKETNSREEHNVSLTYIPSNKKSKKEIFLEEIRSFKVNLPNSMKIIELEDLDDFDSENFAAEEDEITKPNHNDLAIEEDNSRSHNCHSRSKEKEKEKVISMKCVGFKEQISSSVTMKIINDESLIDCLCLYGLSEEPKYNEELDEEYIEPELAYCSKNPHQIVKHTAKLLYPEKVTERDLKLYHNDEAVEIAVNLVTETIKSELKAFTLIFEPAILSFEDEINPDHMNSENIEIIDLVNREKRFYAISLAFDDFDIVHLEEKEKVEMDFENSIEEDIYHHKRELEENNKGSLPSMRSNKTQSQEIKSTLSHTASVKSSNHEKEEQFTIRKSRKILTIFTKYPFIPFFEELLVALLKESFELRKEAMRRNLSQLCNFEHSKTIEFIKIFYEKLDKEYGLRNKFEHKINEILEIKYLSARMNRMESLFLELSRYQLKSYYSEIWAYPILRLFTLDIFLDVLTLILLEEKVIFVCENEHVLTSTIFLFIKVLMQPFNYPYPVVSIIPNQYDYFNAPFPIVYGLLNSKESLLKEKIPKLYQNVYIIITPQGIEIISHKNYSSKIQSVKSPKLRDKLLPYFIKIENQEKSINPQKDIKQPRFSGISSFLGFKANLSQINKEQEKFTFYNNNRQIAHQIIDKVFTFLNGIKQKLPQPEKVKEIRKQIEYEVKTKTFIGDLKNLDIDKETYERVREELSKKTQDPFVLKFLSTQIVGMEILK